MNHLSLQGGLPSNHRPNSENRDKNFQDLGNIKTKNWLIEVDLYKKRDYMSDDWLEVLLEHLRFTSSPSYRPTPLLPPLNWSSNCREPLIKEMEIAAQRFL